MGKGFLNLAFMRPYILLVIILFISCSTTKKEKISCGQVFQGEILPISFQYGPKWNIAEYESDKTIEIDYEGPIIDNVVVRNDDFQIEINVWKPNDKEHFDLRFEFLNAAVEQYPNKLKITDKTSVLKNINGHDWRIDSMIIHSSDENESIDSIKFWILGSYKNFGSFTMRIQQSNLENKVLESELECFISSLEWSPVKKQNR